MDTKPSNHLPTRTTENNSDMSIEERMSTILDCDNKVIHYSAQPVELWESEEFPERFSQHAEISRDNPSSEEGSR